MLKVNDALWVNNGFVSCVAFDQTAHRHGTHPTRFATISVAPHPHYIFFVIINPLLFGEFSYAYVWCYSVRVQLHCHLSNKAAINGSVLW